MLDPRLTVLLACPVDGSPLRWDDGCLISGHGRRFPVIDGVPVLFHPDANNSIPAMARSRAACSASVDPLRLDTLDVHEQHRAVLADAVASSDGKIDPVVSQMVAATGGNLYRHLVGRLPRYPIPDFPMKHDQGKRLLDLGCNWGRWCFAAAKEGFFPIGIDPQLGAVLAAKRVASQLGINALFVCGDARHLPFRVEAFDAVFSYSVLQHLPPNDVNACLSAAARVLKPGGEMMVQMPGKLGPRNLLQQARRGFREASGFEVRYWSIGSLKRLFTERIGKTRIDIEGFFGIGLLRSDADLLQKRHRLVLAASEMLKKLLNPLPGANHLADSVYVRSAKPAAVVP